MPLVSMRSMRRAWQVSTRCTHELGRYLQRSQLRWPGALAGAWQWGESWSAAGQHKGSECSLI